MYVSMTSCAIVCCWFGSISVPISVVFHSIWSMMVFVRMLVVVMR